MSVGTLTGTSLSKVYRTKGSRRPDITAAAEVNLTLEPGERVALIGRSGSGKSTVLKMLLALERADEGSVTFGYTEVLPGPVRTLRWFRRHVQYIPQDPASSLDPRMTVEALVTEPLRCLAVPGNHREIAEEALTSVHLGGEFLGRTRAQISGGQAQRVAIARAIATGATCLLADEPVSGLDPPLRDEVIGMLREVSESRRTSILMVTHDLEAARSLCTRGLVMHKGRIVESGTMAALLNNPATDETRTLARSFPTVPEYFRRCAGGGE